jgi:hypothetical protein
LKQENEWVRKALRVGFWNKEVLKTKEVDKVFIAIVPKNDIVAVGES